MSNPIEDFSCQVEHHENPFIESYTPENRYIIREEPVPIEQVITFAAIAIILTLVGIGTLIGSFYLMQHNLIAGVALGIVGGLTLFTGMVLVNEKILEDRDLWEEAEKEMDSIEKR